MPLESCGTREGGLGLNPYLFIVGSPRSGTTLLRRILDAHSQIAILPESPWIVEFYKKRTGLTLEGLVTRDLVPKLIEHPKFRFLDVSDQELEHLVEACVSTGYALFISRFFEHCGRRRGKRLVGDKTPDFVRQIRILHALWPRMKFVHLIRDGRDVCLSVLNWKRKVARLAELFTTWQEDPVSTAALCWERDTVSGRTQGRLLGPELYYEIRYESLVTRPEEEIERLCSFLKLSYEPAMLQFHQGRTVFEPGLSPKDAWLPITPALRDWKSQMPRDDVERFEAAAGGLLDELGYALACPSLDAVRRDRAARLRQRFSRGLTGRNGEASHPAGARPQYHSANPYLFIVGCPRSGTTLLQRLVDSHPQMAITPETHWIPRWFHKRQGKGLTPHGLVTDKFVQKLFSHSRFLELGLDRSAVGELIRSEQGARYDRFISRLFDLFGQREGKPIVGDKTPGYARELPTLHRLWPAARFIHLIRDGRDVCLSILDWKRAKSWKTHEGAARFRSWAHDPIGTAALWWEWHVRLAREAGLDLGPARYHEMRYESLVARPADQCRALCEFLAVPWHDRMVQAYDDKAIMNRLVDFKHPWLPVTPGLRDWQSQMRSEDLRHFEAVAGTLLEELGYPCATGRDRGDELECAARLRQSFIEDAQSQDYSVPTAWQS
jgi:hypothetical protein